MYCTNCGKKIRDDARFCPYCGEKIKTFSGDYKATETEGLQEDTHKVQPEDILTDKNYKPGKNKTRITIATIVVLFFIVIILFTLKNKEKITNPDTVSQNEEASEMSTLQESDVDNLSPTSEGTEGNSEKRNTEADTYEKSSRVNKNEKQIQASNKAIIRATVYGESSEWFAPIYYVNLYTRNLTSKYLQYAYIQNTDVDSDTTSDPQKDTYDYVFDENGNAITEYTRNEERTTVNNFTFDEWGNVLSMNDVEVNYQYQGNRVTSFFLKDNSSDITCHIHYEYDDEGRISSYYAEENNFPEVHITYSGNAVSNVSVDNLFGRGNTATNRLMSDQYGDPIRRIYDFQANEEGQILTITFYTEGYDETPGRCEFEYNSDGTVAEYTLTRPSSNMSGVTDLYVQYQY